MSTASPMANPRPAPSALLARLGEAMARHRGAILVIQWAVVAVYAALLLVPPFLDLPPASARLVEHFTLVAQFVFWGVWWPLVILSVMLLGRVWCGVFCPEGALTEIASRHGLGRPIPKWLAWPGWPFVAFLTTTVYGQLVTVYEYPKPALLILGGSTVAAVGVGLLYGRGKRVWCRHLCPVSGVFALLSRLAPVHFAVDGEAWKRSAHERHPAVDCAPLVDLRRMKRAADCHLCGRCSGHRGAIALAPRRPGAEILERSPGDTRPWEVLLLAYGLLGVAVGAFQWSASPWFVALKQHAAAWLIERDRLALLEANAPWWLLTHYPQANDAFTWLDGGLILGYIAATALVLGTVVLGTAYAAGRLLGLRARAALFPTYAYTPLAGIGLFLGLSLLTVSLLSAEGIALPALDLVRAALLGLGLIATLALGVRMGRAHARDRGRLGAAVACLALGGSAIILAWIPFLYLW